MKNAVRDKLRAGGTPMGVMAFDFFTPGLAPTLAQAGAEFVLLDMEHSGAASTRSRCNAHWRAVRGSCRWCAFRRACIT
jgi:2-keto-3-deoxy-L-rhamnonate aldolase RhmA